MTKDSQTKENRDKKLVAAYSDSDYEGLLRAAKINRIAPATFVYQSSMKEVDRVLKEANTK